MARKVFAVYPSLKTLTAVQIGRILRDNPLGKSVRHLEDTPGVKRGDIGNAAVTLGSMIPLQCAAAALGDGNSQHP
jgi:hypothetical protein